MNFVTLNFRQIMLLEKMLSSQAPFSLKGAAEAASMSSTMKTVRSDFYVIQRFCEDYDVKIALDHGIVTITYASQDSIDSLKKQIHMLYQNSQITYNQQRYLFIILDCLLEKKIPSLDMWSRRFNVTRPCIQRDVKLAKAWLDEFSISLQVASGKGYQLRATESAIRSALLSWVVSYFEDTISNQLLNSEANSIDSEIWIRIFGTPDFRYILEFVTRLCKRLKIEVNAKKYIELALEIGIMICRIQAGHTLSAAQLEGNRSFQSGEETVMEELRLDLSSHFHIEVSEVEAFYILYRIVMAGFTDVSYENGFRTSIMRATNAIARSVELITNIPFQNDPYFLNGLFSRVSSLFNKTDRPSRSAHEFRKQLQIEYPLEATVCDGFQRFVKREMDLEISNEDALAIGIHLASEIEKLRYSLKGRKRALLVSANAISASSLLYWQLQNEFDSRLEIVKVVSYQEALSMPLEGIDVVISTIPLSNLGRRNVIVSPVLTDEDKKEINAYLNFGDKFSSQNSAKSKIPVFPYYEAGKISSAALMELVGGMMAENGLTDEPCGQSFLRNEDRYGSMIRTEIPFSIPRLDPDLVKNEGLIVVVAKYPLRFEAFDRSGLIQTHVAFFRAFHQHSLEDGLELYSALSPLYKTKCISALLKCTSDEDIVQFIKHIHGSTTFRTRFRLAALGTGSRS